jgi:hypothetical protein
VPRLKPLNLEVWWSLFTAANQFRDAEPWLVLDDDTQLFGVVDLATETTYYCCVIGTAGQVFGLIAYRGAGGYAVHHKMYHAEIPPELDPNLGHEQDCLMAEFTFREELTAPDRALIKKLGLKYRGFGYPQFRDFHPGIYPQEIQDTQATILTECLEVGLIVHAAVLKNKNFLKKKNHIRTWKKGSNGAWTESWVKAPTVKAKIIEAHINEPRVAELKKMKLKPSGLWEAGNVFFPGSVPTGDGSFYAPRLCVISDQRSGFIFSHRLLEPSADAALNLLNALLDAIKSSGYIPSGVVVQESALAHYLLPTLRELNIKVLEMPVLPAIFNMLQELKNYKG